MAYSDNFAAALTALVDSITSADKLELSNMLYEKSFETGDIVSEHEIVTDVRTGQIVPILKDNPNPDSFPFVNDAACVITECDVAQEFSSKTWDLGLIECRVPICLRTFSEDFLRFFNVYRHTQEGELNLDDAILEFITGKFTKNHLLAEWRASWFGDTASLSALYNGIDGFFAQAEANAGLVIDITQNAGLTFADQKVTGEQVYEYLMAAYDEATNYPWFDPSLFEFRVTRSMSLPLVAWLNRQGNLAPNNCACIDPTSAVARPDFLVEGLTINGIPVKTVQAWDSIINYSTVLNGGGGVNARVKPNRAILTYRSNLLIGTSETNALQSFDIWYDKTDKKVYLEGSSYIGAQIPLDEYILLT